MGIISRLDVQVLNQMGTTVNMNGLFHFAKKLEYLRKNKLKNLKKVLVSIGSKRIHLNVQNVKQE